MPARSRLTAVVLVVTVALSASACGSDDAAPEASANATPTPSQPAARAEYVALGDSYTAALGVPETDDTSACGRSSANYPSLVAEELDLGLVDVSCSGADTLDLAGAQDTRSGPVPPQLSAITTETRLVTMGMGGNDEGLFGDLVRTCLSVSGDDPTGSPCRDSMTVDGTDRALERVHLIEGRLTTALTSVKQLAPTADVVLVGYPQIIPATGQCDFLPLADGDYGFVREVTKALGAATRAAAAEADVLYVDTLAASKGHDVCAGADAWVNGIANDQGRPAAPLHPFAEEQAAVAQLVVEALKAKTP